MENQEKFTPQIDKDTLVSRTGETVNGMRNGTNFGSKYLIFMIIAAIFLLFGLGMYFIGTFFAQ